MCFGAPLSSGGAPKIRGEESGAPLRENSSKGAIGGPSLCSRHREGPHINMEGGRTSTGTVPAHLGHR